MLSETTNRRVSNAAVLRRHKRLSANGKTLFKAGRVYARPVIGGTMSNNDSLESLAREAAKYMGVTVQDVFPYIKVGRNIGYYDGLRDGYKLGQHPPAQDTPAPDKDIESGGYVIGTGPCPEYPAPEGFIRTGELRPPKEGEWYEWDGAAQQATKCGNNEAYPSMPILRPTVDDTPAPEGLDVYMLNLINDMEKCILHKEAVIDTDKAAPLIAAFLAEKTRELRAELDLFRDASRRGTELWCRAHPDQKLTWPDAAKNIAWMIDRIHFLSAENAALQKELRGDIDDLICKCGCEDCAETTARYDIEASGLDDQRRLRIMRAYVVKTHKENAALKAEVKSLQKGVGNEQ